MTVNYISLKHGLYTNIIVYSSTVKTTSAREGPTRVLEIGEVTHCGTARPQRKPRDYSLVAAVDRLGSESLAERADGHRRRYLLIFSKVYRPRRRGLPPGSGFDVES